MTAKLFRTSMAVAVSVMVLSIALFMGMLYQYFSDQMMTDGWLMLRCTLRSLRSRCALA